MEAGLKRFLSLTMAIVMVIGMMPTHVAHAAEDDGLCPHHEIHGECGYVERESACGYVCEICAQATEETTEPPATETKPVCTGLADCAAENHSEGCEKAAADAKAAEEEAARKAAEEKAAADKAAADVVAALIEALPALADIQAKPLEKQGEDYTQVNAAYDAYMALTADQQALLMPAEDVFKPYFDYFGGLTQEAATSGSCGPFATWSFDSNTGVLTISGQYQINDYDEYDSPWDKSGIEDDITAVVIEEGITVVGAYAFDSASNIASVSLPNTLTTIDEGAFRYTESLKEITIPASVTSIKKEAFADCSDKGLTKITFKGDCPTIQNPTGTRFGPFANVTATVYYPKGNTTYNNSTKLNYGGNLTWVAYDPCADGHTAVNGVCICGAVEISETTFPDANFRNIIATDTQQVPGASDGWLTAAELAEVTSLSIHGYEYNSTEITDLTGIEYFANLTSLYCYGNKLTKLDISKNTKLEQLYCYNNQLTELDVGKNTALWYLECAGNALTKLDVSKNTALKVLRCDENNLTALDVSSNTLLETLYCQDNQLTALDISKNTALKELTCQNNKLTVLDTSNNTVLERLNCSNNCLTSLDLNSNLQYLSQYGFTCTGNTYTITVTDNQFDLTQLPGNFDVSKASSWSGGEVNGNILTATKNKVTYSYKVFNGVQTGSGGYTDVKRISFVLNVQGFVCSHDNMTAGTCTTPAKCGNCGYEGEIDADNHTWENGACKECGVVGGKCGDNLTWTLVDGVLTISGTGAMREYNVSSSSSDYAPWHSYTVTKIVVEEGVTSIGVAAFIDMRDVTSVTLPAGLLSIDAYAFKNAYGFASIDLPDGLQTVGEAAFYHSGLTSVAIPDSVTTIGKLAFEGSNNLASVKLPTGITTIAYQTFKGCGLTSVTIPENVTWIGSYAFNACSKLTSVTISDSVQEIGSNAFDGCTVLTEIVLPKNLEKIGYAAFDGCSKLKTVKFTGKVPTFDSGAFSGLATTCYYPATDSSWTAEVLKNYGGNVTWVAYDPCAGGHTFVSGVCTACGAKEYIASGKCGENLTWVLGNDGTLTISGSGRMSTYTPNSLAPWNAYVNEIKTVESKNGVENIAPYAFFKHKNLVSIDIPDSVTSIGISAFSYCSGLTSIEIPDGVTKIENDTFSSCTGLTSIKIPDSVDSIGTAAFYYCKNMASVTIPDTVTSIGQAAFSGCSALTDVYYEGTQTKWSEITIGTDNTGLGNANKHYGVTTPTGHWTEDIKAPTCGEAGYTREICACEVPYVRNEVTDPATGEHTFAEVADSKYRVSEATCQSLAVYKKSCSACGAASETETFTHGEPNYENHSFVNDVCACGAVKISEITFPDANFRSYIMEQNYGKDGLLTNAERNEVTSISVSYKNIEDLTGISYFTVLDTLYCDYNQLTELDMSKNTALTYLGCHFNQLTALDVSNNTALERLSCGGNKLTALDVSKNTALTFLNCGESQLTALDVSKNIALKTLWCDSNQLTALDVSNNTVLTELYCYSNQLTALDVSKNTALAYLNCADTQLTELDVSKNTALIHLVCDSNQLTALDVSNNTALAELYCNGNVRTVSVTQNQFDLSTLVGFDASKASNWQGGTVSGNILTATAETVTYTYDLGNGYTGTFALKIDSFCNHNFVEKADGKYLAKEATCTAQAEYYKSCSVCGTEGTETFKHGELKKHICENEVVDEKYLAKEATCTAQAEYYKSCACGAASETETFTRGEPNYENHDYADGVCSRCGLPEGLQYSVADGEVTIIGYLGSADRIVIPETIEGKPVVTIGQSAFYSCTFKEIALPDRIEKIGEHAFHDCSELTTVNIPEAVTEIGEYAFAGCGNLKQIEIPASITELRAFVFMDCANLETVKLPDNLRTVGDSAFNGCRNLKNVTIPASVNEIGEYAFARCQSIEQIVIPQGVTTLRAETFFGCLSLTDIQIPDSVIDIERSVFQRCSSLKEIEIPASVESIGMRAFWESTALETVRFMGDAPAFGELVFLETRATVCYSRTSEGWTTEVMQNYGGNVTWKMYCPNDEHAYTPVVTAPTCTADGYTTYTCPCGDTYTGDEVGKLSHIGGTATCKEQALCTRCGEPHGDLDPANHTGGTEIRDAKAATCMADGYTGDTWCLGCVTKIADGEPITKLDHDMGDWVTDKDVTCTADGSKRKDCSRCDHCETEVIPAVGHDHEALVMVPTCTTNGYTIYKCHCGDTYTDDEVSMLGHDMSDWVVVSKATCTEDGLKRKGCSRCEYYENEVIPANGHAYEAVATPPTCVDNGYTTHTCSVCGDSYVDTYEDALGHELGEWTVVTEPAPGADGEERRDCGYCDYFETRATQYQGNVLKLEGEDLLSQSVVYINGLPYAVKGEGENRYVELPTEEDCYMVTYTYHVGDASDIHTQYPTGMKAYKVKNGEITYIPELDNLLQYSGSSIRITGKKGIRMITSLTKDAKAALTGKGLAGYKLLEYGTALCFASEVTGDGDLVLGKSYTRSNYAYKKGVADPVFATSGNLTQYTNVLVGFSLDQCKDDIAMRPYIILEDENGEQVTLYGGTIYRSIGYIAYQNRNVFQPKTASYNYVWEIIHHVCGDKYDADYKG